MTSNEPKATEDTKTTTEKPESEQKLKDNESVDAANSPQKDLALKFNSFKIDVREVVPDFMCPLGFKRVILENKRP